MPDRYATSMQRLRENIARHVHASSLRAVARQVGMSPTALDKFLGGGTPYSSTRRKLYTWWLREGRRARADLSASGIGAALASLVAELPAEKRETALFELVDTLKELYDAQGPLCPAWLAEVAIHWAPELGLAPFPPDAFGEEEELADDAGAADLEVGEPDPEAERAFEGEADLGLDGEDL